MSRELTPEDLERMRTGKVPFYGKQVDLTWDGKAQDLLYSPESYETETAPSGDIMLISQSHASVYCTIFEDDGETGYFFPCENHKELLYLDSLHIYDAFQIKEPIKAEIIWSEDGFKSALLINGVMQAAVNYEIMTSCCRTNFPPADSRSPFSAEGHAWRTDCIDWFKKAERIS